MRRNTVLFIVCLLISASVSVVQSAPDIQGFTVVESSTDRMVITCHTPDNTEVTQVSTNEKDDNILRDVGIAIHTMGEALPAWSRWIEVPVGKQPEIRIISKREIQSTASQLTIFPPPENTNTVQQFSEFHRMELQKNVVSNSVATISEPVLIGGKYFTLLDIFPFQMSESGESITLTDEIQVEISFKSSANAAPESNKRNAAVYRELERALSPGISRDEPDQLDLLGHYVIVIDNEELIEIIQPLVDWKRRMGYMVTIANLEEIGDDREDLRDWLTAAWNEWEIPPNFVLLTGDVTGEISNPYFDDGVQVQTSWHASDHQFVCWDDGNTDLEEWIAEGFIGRLPAPRPSDLEHMVAKILAYESDPYVDSDWVEGGVLIANGVQSCITTNQAVRELMTNVGYERGNIHESYSFYPQLPNMNTIANGVNGGVGFVNFRGYQTWGGVYYNTIHGFNNRGMMPAVTGMVCATNDFTNTWVDAQPESRGEAWVLSWSNGPRGGISCWGPTDLYTHTWFNNVLNGEYYHLLLNRGIHTLGALCAASQMHLYKAYPSSRRMGDGNTVGFYFYTYNILGDPGLQIWTRDPEEISIDLPVEIAAGSTLLTGNVLFTADDRAAENAYVHFYQVVDDTEIHFGGYTDENGILRLELSPIEAGEYLVTVTGPNMIPILCTVEVNQAPVHLTVGEYSVNDEEAGNGDGVVNPGETFELTVNLTNTGSESSEEADVELIIDSPWVELQSGATTYASAEPGESAGQTEPFILSMAAGTPHGSVISCVLHVTHGDEEWDEAFSFSVNGYHLALNEWAFVNVEQLAPGETDNLIVTIQNVGDMDTESLRATLTCANPRIQISDSESLIGVITAGETVRNVEQPFEIFAGANAYPGEMVSLCLTLSDEAGLTDQLSLEIMLGGDPTLGPQGPTPYGYWAIDNRDTSSGLQPEYDWLDGDTEIRMTDNNDAGSVNGIGGDCETIDLPFEFIYFGKIFNQITIGTNGWMAFGASGLISWNNQPMGSGLDATAMLAPYWNDLWSGTVYTTYDEENGRFIVEWRNFSDNQGRHRFEVQLYNPRFRITRTGDSEFVFVYHESHDEAPPRDVVPNERVTIGFTSPDRDDGMTITHARQWDPHTAGLEGGMSVRFTTGAITEQGSVSGTVISAETQQPMPNVRVMLDGTGFFSVTDVDGGYSITEAPVGTYSVTAFQRYFNRGTAADIQIQDGEDFQIDFEMTYPTFNIDVEDIRYGLWPDSIGSAGFAVWNEGNGPLDYDIFLNYEAEEPERDEEWDILFDWSVGDTVGDTGLYGMAFDGEIFYISGQLERRVLPHKIYMLDKNGSLVGDIDQFTVDSTTSRGYYEMDFKDDNLIAVEGNNIIEITTDGDSVSVTPAPEHPTQSLVYNPVNGTYFTKSIAGNILYEIDVDGNVINRIDLPAEIRYIRAMSWFTEDENDCNLYLFCHNRSHEDNGGTGLQLSKINPATGEFYTLRYLDFESMSLDDRPQGCVITKFYDPMVWTFIGLVNHASGEHLIGWELGPNLTWIRYEPESGQIPAGERQEYTINFSAIDMPERDYYVVFELFHNAAGDRFDIPIFFNIGEQQEPDTSAIGDIEPMPHRFALENPAPNPFNNRTMVRFELPKAMESRLRVFDLNGRAIETMADEYLSAGSHSIAWNAEALPAGVYFLMLEAGQQKAVKKAVLIK